jgi:hypothetical protein
MLPPIGKDCHCIQVFRKPSRLPAVVLYHDPELDPPLFQPPLLEPPLFQLPEFEPPQSQLPLLEPPLFQLPEFEPPQSQLPELDPPSEPEPLPEFQPPSHQSDPPPCDPPPGTITGPVLGLIPGPRFPNGENIVQQLMMKNIRLRMNQIRARRMRLFTIPPNSIGQPIPTLLMILIFGLGRKWLSYLSSHISTPA